MQNDFNEILILIEQSRKRAFRKVNEEIIRLYYEVGKIVHQKVNSGKWGSKTVDQLAEFILSKMPGLSGFNRRGLYRMKQFYELYAPDSVFFQFVTETKLIESPLASQIINNDVNNGFEIVSPTVTQFQNIDNLHEKFMTAILTQIPWSLHIEIMSGTRTPEEKFFYLLLTIKENLTKQELRRQIKSAVFERNLLAKQKISKITNNKIAQPLFKDPYIFEFLDLPENFSEKDLEKALIQNLKNFILEIGKGFTYMGNQFRIQVGNKDFYTDLLFYQRDLQCLVLFELKVEEFQPEFLGKLNFYLEALDRDVKRNNENPSIGVLLCKGKDDEVVEYAMARNISPAIVADFETKIIKKEILKEKLIQWSEIFDKSQDL